MSFFSLGSIIVMIFNGIMLGSFQYFFLERGLVMESMLTIWLHGTLEISAIIIAGAAGIVLGKGFVFPGTHSRLRAFQQSARLGIKLLIGIVPILVFAAIIESFLTRYTDAPAVIKLALIICSLVFILFYFAWLPYKKHRNGTIQPIKDSSSKADDYNIEAYNGEVQSMNEIFRDSVVLYTKIFKKYFIPALGVCALAVTGYAFALKGLIEGGLIQVDSFILMKVLSLLEHTETPLLFLINALALAGLIYLAYNQTLKFFNNKISKAKIITAALTIGLILNALFFMHHVLAIVLFLLIFPLGLYVISVMFHEGVSFGSAFSRFREFLGQSGGRMIGLYALLIFILSVFMFLIDSPFMTFYLDFVQSSFAYDATIMYYLALAFNGLVITLGIAFILPLFIIGSYIQYQTLSEITTAKYLLEKINAFNK
ncbi:stage II sporulation protein M [Fulvivirga ligni]|nr:stage II sporulation protein M [Fulvivirga ligni]UII19491.1 stage II sporulation protein M [Fulvivirga ligni]